MQKTTIEMQAKGLDYQALNASLRALGAAQVAVHGVMGQRYLGCGMQDQCLKLYGTPGNGLGQYLSGGTIEVFGSAQEATGDTMNAGEIIVHGRCGDAAALSWAVYGAKPNMGSNPVLSIKSWAASGSARLSSRGRMNRAWAPAKSSRKAMEPSSPMVNCSREGIELPS